MKKSYSDLLKDPRWQKKRLEIMERDKFKCCDCCDGDIELHVHHKVYIKGNNPWEYPDDLLVTLCKDCHAKYHENKEKLNIAIAGISPMFLEYYVEFIETTNTLWPNELKCIIDLIKSLNYKSGEKSPFQ